MTDATHIYVISAGAGLVKIGLAASVEHRRRTLQTGCPSDLVIVFQAAIPKASALAYERSVHARLQEHHRRGEWFECADDRAVHAVSEVLANPPRAAPDAPAPRRVVGSKQRAELVQQFIQAGRQRPIGALLGRIMGLPDDGHGCRD